MGLDGDYPLDTSTLMPYIKGHDTEHIHFP